MEEIWKDIEEYDGQYQVSNLGNVRSLKFGKVRILKQSVHKQGYKNAKLCKNGKEKVYKVHRLVAEAFIPNPNNLPIINHKDENPSNNNVDNLEFCTHKYNMNYGNINQKKSVSMKGKHINRTDLSKHILQYSKNGEFVAEYPSLMEASRQTGIDCGHISACCIGKKYRHSAGGYVWKYKEKSEA